MGKLLEVATKHNTDKKFNGRYALGKWGSPDTQTYIEIYDQILEPFHARDNVCFLEIGVKQGDSIRMWMEYFRGKVLGMDIDPNCYQPNDPTGRVKVFIGDQSSPDDLQKVIDYASRFDIIMDDGSHLNEHMIASYTKLWPYVKKGGVYIIEDLLNTYTGDMKDAMTGWVGMQYNKKTGYTNDRAELNEFFMGLVKDMDYLTSDIRKIEFYPMICVIYKR